MCVGHRLIAALLVLLDLVQVPLFCFIKGMLRLAIAFLGGASVAKDLNAVGLALTNFWLSMHSLLS